MKTLLVHVDGTSRCAARLQIARDLARRHGLHPTVLYATAPPLIGMGYGYGHAAEAAPIDLLIEIDTGWRRDAIAAFNAVFEAPQAAWAELGPLAALDGFVRQALFADLLVLGQHDPADANRQLPADFVSSMLIASGRPALVVPYAGTFEHVGNRVLVAWKPSAESARALAAALPLLRGADRVDVVQWGDASDNDCRGEALDVERYLRLHEVEAAVHRHPDDPNDAGELLLSRAADLGADLLVMGCYGHSRAREFVLGGATRTVLATMTLPVLMSH